MRSRFTGTHMATITIAFFGVVIAVNMVMAVEATRTFGGTVVENSYVASQHFNRWLGEARAEAKLGWTADARREDGHVLLTLTDDNGALANARVTAIAEHPLGRQADVHLHFAPLGEGRFRSIEAMPSGRWRLKLDITTPAARGRLLKDLPA